MLPYLREHYADPGRLHAEGHATRVAVESAREQVAARFGARPREVVFTATGTEAVNTAVWGALARGGPGHVVTTAVEHSSVLDAVARGTTAVTTVGVDRLGRFDPAEVAAGIRPDTVLVSVQLANHEVGTLQPAKAVVEEARARNVVVPVDACAAAGHLEIDFGALGADLCSITGHTFGAPKGAAAVLVRRGVRLPPVVVGGGAAVVWRGGRRFPPFVVGGAQERARRAGIEDVPAIVGFGAAADDAGDDAERERMLSERLAREAVGRVSGVERFGDPRECLPHLVCLGIDGVEAEPILLALDQRGVAVHSGSSCSSESLEPSPVLTAMGVDADRSLRASVGCSSTDADVDAFVDALPGVVESLRGLRR